MIQEYSSELVIVTQKSMMTFSEVQMLYPKVKIVIQNFAIEHSIPNEIVETIAVIKNEHPLWVHFSVDIEAMTQNILIYMIYMSYELIESFGVSLENHLGTDQKELIFKRLSLVATCKKCQFYSFDNNLYCAVNPSFLTNKNNECGDYKPFY